MAVSRGTCTQQPVSLVHKGMDEAWSQSKQPVACSLCVRLHSIARLESPEEEAMLAEPVAGNYQLQTS